MNMGDQDKNLWAYSKRPATNQSSRQIKNNDNTITHTNGLDTDGTDPAAVAAAKQYEQIHHDNNTIHHDNKNASMDTATREKLTLSPRSTLSHPTDLTPSPPLPPSLPSDKASKTRVNPFGNARPREEILARKGIDVKALDRRIESKAHVAHYTRDQEAALNHIRAQLQQAEELWKHANENELPEERYRLLMEQKRKELSLLMQTFRDENESTQRGEDQDYRTNRPSTYSSPKPPTFHSSYAFRDTRSH